MRTSPPNPLSASREGEPKHAEVRRTVGIFVFLCALCFIFYSGVEFTTDERLLWDGVHSFAQHGNLWLNYSNTLRSPGIQPQPRPVPVLDSEPGQVWAATPLFLIAERLPGLGLLQTVWLLNVIVTGGIGALLYHYVRLLGYRPGVGIAAALLFGTATYALEYSKTFFREPLFMLIGLGAFYAAERWQRSRRVGWLGLMAVGFVAALVVKDAAIFLLPALIVAVLPAFRLDRRSLLIMGGLLIAGLIVVLIVPRLLTAGRLDVFARLQRAIQEADEAPYALAGYLFSPGHSFIAFSPIMLLGIPGGWLLWKMRQWRALMVPLVLFASFTVGYAVLQNRDWYGGLGWGPRYLLPITPLMLTLTLPVLARFQRLNRLLKVGIVGIICLSIAFQFLGVLIPVAAYYRFLAEEGVRQNRVIVGWIDGTWNLSLIPQVILPQLIGKGALDLAWAVNGVEWVAGLCVAVMGLAAILIITPIPSLFFRQGVFQRIGSPSLNSERGLGGEVYLPALSLVALVTVFYIGLRAAYPDPRYGGRDPNTAAALDAITREATPDTAILLGSEAYRPAFMNYYKGRAPIYQLPASPGEVDVPGLPAKITSTNPDALIAAESTMMLARIAQLSPRWLYLTEFIPGDATRTRAMERYLARHYFPISEPLTTNTARVIEFSAQSAPPDYIPPWPERASGANFGGLITLSGYDLPRAVRRGDVITLSILWHMQGVATFDYSVNVSLIAPDGRAIAQRSGTPQGTFGRLTQWRQGSYQRDGHGLRVPPDTPPGTYTIWVLLYNWQDNSRLAVTLDGAAVGDYLTLATIRVE